MTTAPAPGAGGRDGALLAVTVVLPPPAGPGDEIDPLAVAGADGWLFFNDDLVLAAVGAAETLPLAGGLADEPALSRIRARLSALPGHDEVGRPGTGVLALAALPFDPREAASVVVPRLTYGRAADGTEWVTVVGPGADPHLAGDAAPAGAAGAHWRRHLVAAGSSVPHGRAPADAGVIRTSPSPAPGDYAEAVAAAVRRMEVPGLRKVVLARCLHVRFDRPPDAVAVLRRLRDQEPSCTVFSMPVGPARFLGASPELLVSRRGRAVVSRPLAGTVGLDAPDDRAAAGLLTSAKDRREHRFVVDHIAEVLAPRCDSLSVPGEPTLALLRSVAHLQTPITGVLSDRGGSAGVPSALQLLAALHPTPAVGGTPTAAALDLIGRLEAEPRGPWAGAVGWTSADGDGDWYLGIRSALLDGSSARLLAGAGIVADSVPDQELAETTIKLRPVLSALAPGAGDLLHPPPR